MPRMDIDLEIHVPGLDLHHERWNYHVLFMDEVHKMYRAIGVIGWQCYKKDGRGVVFVDRDQWMKIIRGKWDEDGEAFPCHYVKGGSAHRDADFEMLRSGFTELVHEYDPEKQVVMVVQHHSADLLSCYLLRFDGITTSELAKDSEQ